jgi:hypothetical protein
LPLAGARESNPAHPPVGIPAEAPTHLRLIVRSRLRKIQCQPDLINALLGQTGLTLGPQPL